MNLLTASALELAALIRAKKVSSLEVVDAHIARIEAVNGPINAVVNERFDAAREEARTADARTVREDEASLPPLHGVPCTVKEFFAIRGLPQSGGMLRRKGYLPERDAVVVERVRKAGAIVLGNTNAPEGGLWMETYNKVYGRTNNPWDLERTSGGSSGGEAAIIAAGGAPFGIGSDIGGSIRLPSAFCGIVGHKPTGRMLPNAGQFPTPNGSARAALTPGPMARHASDLATLTRIMAGQDAEDPYSLDIEMLEPKDVRLEGLTVIPIEENGATRVTDVMKREVRRAAEALEERGAIIKEAKFPRMRFALEMWATMLEQGTTESYDSVIGGERGIPASEFFLLPFGRSQHSFPPLLVALFERVARRLPINRERFVKEADALRAEVEAALGDRGVFIHPPYTRPAPRHHDAWRAPFAATCTALFNVLEFPVSVVPTGFDARGLPLAVQVGAARRRDHVAIRAALALEEHFGGWVMATPTA